jgi:HSP20 family molecular chaperone IbpA
MNTTGASMGLEPRKPGWVREPCFKHQGRFKEGFAMTRLSLLSSPLLLGFEEMERLVDRVGKSGDGYPPYNIERIARNGEANGEASASELLRITLAVAGFKREQLDITLEDNQLVIRGRQEDDKSRDYIHRGIAARQFSRTFVLAEGIEVRSADLSNGLLCIDLVRREPDRLVKKISITEAGP